MKELPYKIDLIQTADLPAFKVLRKLALEESPSAFAKYPFELDEISDETLTSMVCPGAGQFAFGAFLPDGNLIGMAGLFRGKHKKTFHKGTVWGVFVLPEQRGKGISKEILKRVLDHAKSLAGLEQVNLTVSQSQPAAKSLYLSLGFKIFGNEEKALKVEETYFSEEYLVLEFILRKFRSGQYFKLTSDQVASSSV